MRSRADERARHLVDRLGRGAQRDDEERGVAVERDQLAGAIFPSSAKRAPIHVTSTTKRPGTKTWAASSVDCGSRHADAGAADVLGLAAVAVEERLLAADAAQDAQAGGGVGAERGERADLLALVALTPLERLDHGAEEQDEDGHAEEHDQPEHDRRREQDRSPTAM